jgi:hypothetical protein
VAVTDPLDDWWQHETSVQRLAGSNAYGDTYANAATVTGLVDDSTKLVVNAEGEQVVSSARVFYPASTAVIPPGSLVTLPPPFLTHARRVVGVSVHDAGTQDTPNHLEVALQ